MSDVKVVVACDEVGRFDTFAVGQELARAWAATGAQVAQVPIAANGRAIARALHSAQIGSLTESPTCLTTATARLVVPPDRGGDPWRGSSQAIGQSIVDTAHHSTSSLIVDLTTVACHDAGIGLLGVLGARADSDLSHGWSGAGELSELDIEPAATYLQGQEIIGLVDADEQQLPLTSLRGISSVRGRATGRDLRDIMDADQTLARVASLLGIDPLAPGYGAAGGTGAAICALGGRLMSGPQVAAHLTGLESTVRQADLVVGACTSLDIGNYGGPVIQYLAELTMQAEVPFIVCSPQVAMGGRELRQMGIEAAYPVSATDLAQIGASAEGMVHTWSW